MEDGVNGHTEPGMAQARQTLLSNSTKKRTLKLAELREQILKHGRVVPGSLHEYSLKHGLELTGADLSEILSILFDTYSLYVDIGSRHAVEQCLATILSLPEIEAQVAAFLDVVEAETTKTSIAPGNAFVLVRWCALFLQQFACNQPLWEDRGTRTIAAMVRATHTFEGYHPRDSTRQTALRVTRRGFRKLFSASFGDAAIRESITALTTKSPNPCPQNGLIVGVIAGVCARLPHRRTVFETEKPKLNEFFIREILGSRTVLPDYVAKGMHDYFASFVRLEDLRRDLVPAIEKALLRSPEVVLNNIMEPLILSLSAEIDLSELLASNLLKPLLSSARSTNVTIRSGAMRSFVAVAARSNEAEDLEKVTGEILGPIKQGKLTTAEQRATFAQMLGSIKSSEVLAQTIPQGLAAASSKEPNEAAAAAEIGAFMKHLIHALEQDVPVESSVIDTVVKGLGEKRLPFRRLWALQLADALWCLDHEIIVQSQSRSLIDSIVGKMIDNVNEAQANPVAAAQNGQVAAACAATALCLARFQTIPDLKTVAIIKKAAVAEQALRLESKPSFLLNTRVYTKMTNAQDLTWVMRALCATASALRVSDPTPALKRAWAQAFIYVMVAKGVPATVRNDASKCLRDLYTSQPELVAHLITEGLKQWCVDAIRENKDTPSLLAQTGTEELYRVIRSICLPSEQGTSSIDASVLQTQFLDLLVLCRPALLPRIDWIGLCLRSGVDPGQLAKEKPVESMQRLLSVTQVSLL